MNINKSNNKKYCFIGYGSIAKKHIKIINQISKNNEIYILKKTYKKNDIDKNNVLIIKFEDLIKIKIDAFFITNPSSIHYSTLQEIYKLNSNIFIEKPIFEKYYDIHKIIDYQNSIKKKLKVGYMFRHDPLFLYLKKIVEGNLIGKIKLIHIYCGSNLLNWRKKQNLTKSISLKKNLGGGVLRELSHEIDYLLWIFGDFELIKSKLVNTRTFKNCNVEDEANIFLSKKNNDLISLINLNFHEKKTKRFCFIIGEKGEIFADIFSRKITIVKKGKKREKKFEGIEKAYLNQMKNFLNSNFNRKNNDKIIESLNVMKYISKIEKNNEQ